MQVLLDAGGDLTQADEAGHTCLSLVKVRVFYKLLGSLDAWYVIER
jgi:hypothetical protein